MTRKLACTIVAMMFPVLALCQTTLEETLRQKYVGSERMLRHFYLSDTLKFDASGNPLNTEKTGSWTLLSAVVIDKLSLSSKTLELQGHRTIVTIDDATRTMKRVKWGEKVWIRIALLSPAASAPNQILAALNRVFVEPGQDMLSALPDYWHGYMARVFNQQLQGPPCPEADPDAIEVRAPAEPATETSSASATTSAGIIEGRLIHRTEPLYLPVARQAGVQGEIGLRALITKEGDVTQLCIRRAIGGGMDDEVVNTARQWKYSPYLLNGQPVEIKTSIDFRFRMR